MRHHVCLTAVQVFSVPFPYFVDTLSKPSFLGYSLIKLNASSTMESDSTDMTGASPKCSCRSYTVGHAYGKLRKVIGSWSVSQTQTVVSFFLRLTDLLATRCSSGKCLIFLYKYSMTLDWDRIPFWPKKCNKFPKPINFLHFKRYFLRILTHHEFTIGKGHGDYKRQKQLISDHRLTMKYVF